MIWGMTLEPGKLYTEVMGEEVQLSMAAIDSRKDLDANSNSFCQIMMKTSKSEYVLCTLVHGVMFQQSLDLKLMPREKVTFSVQGPNIVYLVGYTAAYPEDEEADLEAEEGHMEGDSATWEAYDEDISIVEDTEVSTVKKEVPMVAEPSAQIPDPQTGQEEMELQDTSLDADGQVVIKTEASSALSTMASNTLTDQDTQQLQDNTFGIQMGNPAVNIPQSQEFFYPENQQQQQSNLLVTPPATFQTSAIPPYQEEPQEEIYPVPETFVKTEGPPPMQAPPPLQAPPMQAMTSPRRTAPSPRQQARGKATQRTRSLPQSTNAGQNRNIGHAQSSPGTSRQGMQQGPTQGEISSGNGQFHHLEAILGPQSNYSPPGQSGDTSQEPGMSYHVGEALFIQSASEQGERVDVGQKQRVGHLCRYCLNVFPCVSALRIHERIHTGERPFTCSQCSKSFIRKEHLQRHQMMHTGEKPTTKRLKRARVRRKPPVRVTCPYCSRGFPGISALRNHERVHTGERPFTCSQCFMSFTQKGHLQRHQITHTGQKRYECPKCGKRFTQNHNLKLHMQAHEEESARHEEETAP